MDLKSEKSFQFAVRTVNLYKHLTEVKREYIMSKQLMRSGTSIGANIREAHFAESTNDFVHKLRISRKEANESLYWLELLKATDFISQTEFDSMAKDCTEIISILTKIIKNSIQK
jgi:four helix bundle protein